MNRSKILSIKYIEIDRKKSTTRNLNFFHNIISFILVVRYCRFTPFKKWHTLFLPRISKYFNHNNKFILNEEIHSAVNFKKHFKYVELLPEEYKTVSIEIYTLTINVYNRNVV